MKKVLVTGGSGFIALHVIEQLWHKNYDIRATVRNQDRQIELLDFAKQHGRKIQIVQADLCDDAGWDQAMQDIDVVIHIASPFPDEPVTDDEILVEPAKEGTLRVLKAACQHKVKRVILTSSIAAIGFGHGTQKDFCDTDWTNVDDESVDAYQKSKTLAERAAWDFIKTQEDCITELCSVNPGLVLGPVLGQRIATSNQIILKMIQGVYPGCPNIQVAMVDVRDVASILVSVVNHADAPGKRFILADKNLWMHEVANILHEAGFEKVSTRVLPNWLFRILGVFDKKMRMICHYLDMEKYYDCSPAKKLLNWRPTDAKKTLISTAKNISKKSLKI